MLKSLKIENFRCFRSFELQQLGRLNLLVGTNNSGKTSILEAIQLLSSRPNFESLGGLMIGRGEYILSNESDGQIELDIRHLFYGNEINIGSTFSVFDSSHDNGEKITISIEEEQNQQRSNLIIENSRMKTILPLSSEGGLVFNLSYFRRSRKDFKHPSHLITSSSLTTETMIELFDQVVLTPEEDLVTGALQILEPNVERIAIIGSEKFRKNGVRSGFVVRFSDSDQRIPIGSMGDGMWRMLGLTLAIVNARNGVLLVDEIDTGLHFSTMSKMWKLIWETAKRLNVQVFATTHSNDCWTSLAAIASAENPSEEGITIQRIEKGKPHSIVFTERQVAIAAERGIEVR
ncbi:AAA+ ATPase domain-containing protein [Tumidithrix helvetica PCC 7403]|uniref:AAA family ATPase n=1 Tax=Tumidithrix helvetica TaxID=3457545 RepID=UPI003C8576F4